MFEESQYTCAYVTMFCKHIGLCEEPYRCLNMRHDVACVTSALSVLGTSFVRTHTSMDSKSNHMHAFARSLFVCVVNLIVRA